MTPASSHLTRFTFCGLRTLKQLFLSPDAFGDRLSDWFNHPKWHPAQKINILIGPNGGGKSTILDMFAVVAHPGSLATLARENRTQDSVAAVMMEFSNRVQLRIGVEPIAQRDYRSEASLDNDIDSQCIRVKAVTLDDKLRPDYKLLQFERNVSKVAFTEETMEGLGSVFNHCGCDMHRWEFTPELKAKDVVKVLNAAGHLLPGLISYADVVPDEDFDDASFLQRKAEPFDELPGEEHRVSVWLASDQAQSSNVAIATLPSGWRHLVSIIAWLESLDKGAIALIDEPEAHLHPKLQRHLLKEMNRLATKKNLQLFIATHSPTFQDAKAWQGNEDKVGILQVDGSNVADEPNVWRLLDMLGMRNSDLAQSNGIIWVEGPSDRVYLKHWLNLWCDQEGKIQPVEHVDYAFAYYGGAVLSHFSVDESAGKFIELLRINRHIALFMDRDNDFTRDAAGKLQAESKKSAKHRVVEEFERLARPTCRYWVTKHYTIESYLPSQFRADEFQAVGERLIPNSGSKTKTSLVYTTKYKTFSTAVEDPAGVGDMMAALFDLIARWNA